MGKAVHAWLKAGRLSLPKGESIKTGEYRHICPLGSIKGRQADKLSLQVRIERITGPGALKFGRYGEFKISDVVAQALRNKLPKLIKTEANRRILLLEREQMLLDHSKIIEEIENCRTMFPQLSEVDELWFAETVFYETQDCVFFHLYEDGQPVQSLGFFNGKLISRAENGMPVAV